MLAHVIRRWKHKHLSFLGKEHQNGTGPLSVLKQNLIKLHSSLFRLLNLHLRRKLLSGLNKCNLFCSKFFFFYWIFSQYRIYKQFPASVLHVTTASVLHMSKNRQGECVLDFKRLHRVWVFFVIQWENVKGRQSFQLSCMASESAEG